ncbi:hypothetical protein TNIN_242241 [Trichonephila inaurata madagascariensis]|uniref:Uncharacterized protein n=1 Tax=Trichonephila inaurata madagascariensis TaxID=2747483 RepID=A0A8X7C8F0_9ARAC|nr:hypothetical protein TNIN_242241 [Trichonephila inaurata madagascariensis]
MRGLKDRPVARKPSSSDVRGQVEDIILGNREAQSQRTAQKQERLCIRHLSNCFDGRSLTGLTLSLFRKGIGVCLNVPHTHPRPRPKPQCAGSKHQGVRARVLENDHLTIRRGSNEGSEGRAVARKPSTFPDVRGRVEDIILGNRERKTSL